MRTCIPPYPAVVLRGIWVRRIGAAVIVAAAALLFHATGPASADAPKPQESGPVSTADPTPEPTDPPTPACRQLTYADANDGDQAVVPGQSMQISTVVRNTKNTPEDGFYMEIGVSVYYAKAPFNSAPFVLQWSRNNGSWHSARFSYHSGGDPTWSTTKIPADPIPNGKSSTFRLKMSFKSNSPRGWYWSYIAFGTDTCDAGVTQSMTFIYNPERIVAHSPRPTARPSVGKSADPSPRPAPTPSTSPLPPKVSAPHSDRLGDFSRTAGTGLSSLLLLAAFVQGMRWWRRRRFAGDDQT